MVWDLNTINMIIEYLSSRLPTIQLTLKYWFYRAVIIAAAGTVTQGYVI